MSLLRIPGPRPPRALHGDWLGTASCICEKGASLFKASFLPPAGSRHLSPPPLAQARLCSACKSASMSDKLPYKVGEWFFSLSSWGPVSCPWARPVKVAWSLCSLNGESQKARRSVALLFPVRLARAAWMVRFHRGLFGYLYKTASLCPKGSYHVDSFPSHYARAELPSSYSGLGY